MAVKHGISILEDHNFTKEMTSNVTQLNNGLAHLFWFDVGQLICFGLMLNLGDFDDLTLASVQILSIKKSP